jgi:hypothetical protein
MNQTELGKENWFSRTPSSPAQGGGASHSLGVNLHIHATESINELSLERKAQKALLLFHRHHEVKASGSLKGIEITRTNWNEIHSLTLRLRTSRNKRGRRHLEIYRKQTMSSSSSSHLSSIYFPQATQNNLVSFPAYWKTIAFLCPPCLYTQVLKDTVTYTIQISLKHYVRKNYLHLVPSPC